MTRKPRINGIRYHSGKYQVEKTIRGKRVYYGRYPTLNEAIQVRNRAEREQWKHPKRKHPKRKHRRGYPTILIAHVNGSWSIRVYNPRNKKTMHIYTNKQFTLIEEKLRQLHHKTLQQVLDYAENNRTYTKKNKHKYIQTRQTTHGQTHMIYRQCKSYGTFNNLQDALRERDLLIQYDWDEDLACEYQYEDVTTPVFPSRVTRK